MNQPELRNLFFYTPLIAAMAGNVGVQSSAIIVQGLANDLVKGSLFSRLLKEVGLKKSDIPIKLIKINNRVELKEGNKQISIDKSKIVTLKKLLLFL